MTIETMEPTLLVADDNSGVRRVLVQMLGAAGLRTVTASDGAQALEHARRFRPDLILLDVNMPGRDGFSVCEELRRDAATRSIPILMLTGRATPEDERHGLDSGADDFVGKPFVFEDLRARVLELLGRKVR